MDDLREVIAIPTNHAILRFQERVAPLPMEEVKSALNTDAIREAIERGCHYFTLESGHQAIFRGRRIVTVLDPGMRPKRAKRKASNAPT